MSLINKEYIAKDDLVAAYLKIVMTWKAKFFRCDFKQISRSENSYPDSLSTLASAVDFQFRREISVEHIPKRSTHKLDEEVLHLEYSSGWRELIISFLKDGTFFEDKAEAQKLQHLATRYILFEGLLYKKSYSMLHYDPYLRCQERDAGDP